ncbi:MAG TPA: tRNA (adenosine(37)-N6)-threonylcarbamoyltransferase complex transferase subunit TsaD [Firmicutes bacterium]|nr:tRNA (adenosine(37)-N6)-threonylcarbamoyltransferase complex transferase subunit TsaD [Bacillota bacterium]
MIVLGIDTSCDDTSVALYDTDSETVLSEMVSSRMELHARYGGVVPEIAARQHLELLLPMIERVHEDAGVAPDPETIDLIAVTRGPGLIGGLLVGFSCAKALSLGWNVPFVGVNHIEGHLVSVSLSHQHVPYPHIAMIVSGGHSELYKAVSPVEYSLLGETRDDAAGELLDKTGRLLDVPFPAGRVIDEWTIKSNPDDSHPSFPRPLIDRENIEFSFSGLKTACLYFLRSDESRKYARETIGAEVLRSVVDCLLAKSLLACRRENLQTLVISGGVASSEYFRKTAEGFALENNLEVLFPEQRHCTDNASMIALAGWHRYRVNGADSYELDCEASLSVGEC